MAGCIAHAEVKYRNAVLMIASGDTNYDTLQLNGQSVGGGLYLCLPTASDVDGWHSRAVEAGAQTVFRQRKRDGVPAEHVSSTLRVRVGRRNVSTWEFLVGAAASSGHAYSARDLPGHFDQPLPGSGY